MSYEEMIIAIANLTHEKFFDIYQKTNNGTRIKITVDKAWIKKHGTDQADLAKLKYSELPSDWQKERWFGSKTALDSLIKTIRADKPLDEKFVEYASDMIHKDWLERNFKKAEDEHKLSYENLSEEAKEKDRIFIRAAIEIYQKNKRDFYVN